MANFPLLFKTNCLMLYNQRTSKSDVDFDRYTGWLFKNPKLNWLRWILVLPTALLASYIPTLFIGLINGFYEPAQWFIDYIEGIPSTFISLIFYVMTGTYLAPQFKINTALILMILFMLFAGISIFLALGNKEYPKILFTIIAILGCINGYKIAVNSEKQVKNKM